MTTDAITSFSGPYAWLSNGYAFPLDIGVRVNDQQPILARTAEHAFQAIKTLIPEQRRWVLAAHTPFGPDGAKARGRQVSLRPDWDERAYKHSPFEGMLTKDAAMLYIQRLKYSVPALAYKLWDTGERDLIEGNDWGDTYWGVCNGVGENVLGDLIMQVRCELQVVYGYFV